MLPFAPNTDLLPDQREAELIKSLTKADMVEFYNTYIDPASPRRARISVHLHAQRASMLNDKVIGVLRGADLTNVPLEQHQSFDLAEKHIRRKTSSGDKNVTFTIKGPKEVGLPQAGPEEDSNKTTGDIAQCSDAINNACEIKNIPDFRASLMTSAGAHPVKDMAAYWDPNLTL